MELSTAALNKLSEQGSMFIGGNIQRQHSSELVVQTQCKWSDGKYLIQQAATPPGERLWGDGMTAGHLCSETLVSLLWGWDAQQQEEQTLNSVSQTQTYTAHPTESEWLLLPSRFSHTYKEFSLVFFGANLNIEKTFFTTNTNWEILLKISSITHLQNVSRSNNRKSVQWADKVTQHVLL